MNTYGKFALVLGALSAMDVAFVGGGIVALVWSDVSPEAPAPQPHVAGLMFLLFALPALLFATVRWKHAKAK